MNVVEEANRGRGSPRASRVVRLVALLAGLGPAVLQAPAAAVTDTAFNPAISLILDARLSSYSRDPEGYSLPGFTLAEEAGLPPEGLSLGESELQLSANVDDKFYGAFTLALADEAAETEVELEEAYIQTTALPHGLTVKAGRFFSDIAYLNVRHAHSWDFVDQPLAYRALLGNQFADTGLQLRWVAPTPLFLELGVEAFRGDAFPAAGAARQGRGAYSFFGRAGGDVGSAHSWRAGVSYLDAEAEARESGEDETVTFSGDSSLWIVDAIWKWAEMGNPRMRHLILQTEYLRRREDGLLESPATGASSRYDGRQSGWYLQAVYQFVPRWRAGLRYDRLRASNELGDPLLAAGLADDAHDPTRVSAMVDFSNSEFSRLRLQFAHDRSRSESDRQVYLQYIMSLGAHGAHRF